jgi:hypothetical protein
VDALAVRAANFHKSLGATSTLLSLSSAIGMQPFKQYVYGDGGQSWFDAEDFRRSARFLVASAAATVKKIVMCRFHLGNTKMRAQNNTTGTLSGQSPEWLLDKLHAPSCRLPVTQGSWRFCSEAVRVVLTCACNAQSDGVTKSSTDQRQQPRL